MESEDSAPNCSSNGELEDCLDEAYEDYDDDGEDDDDYDYRNQNPAVSTIDPFGGVAFLIFHFDSSEKACRWRRLGFIEQFLFRKETVEHRSPSDNPRGGANGIP